jgi:hypothetical protein
MVVDATIFISGWVSLAVDLELQELSNMEPNTISSPNANFIFVMGVNDGLWIENRVNCSGAQYRSQEG